MPELAVFQQYRGRTFSLMSPTTINDVITEFGDDITTGG
jgi:hypothetical protein